MRTSCCFLEPSLTTHPFYSFHITDYHYNSLKIAWALIYFNKVLTRTSFKTGHYFFFNQGHYSSIDFTLQQTYSSPLSRPVLIWAIMVCFIVSKYLDMLWAIQKCQHFHECTNSTLFQTPSPLPFKCTDQHVWVPKYGFQTA